MPGRVKPLRFSSPRSRRAMRKWMHRRGLMLCSRLMARPAMPILKWSVVEEEIVVWRLTDEVDRFGMDAVEFGRLWRLVTCCCGGCDSGLVAFAVEDDLGNGAKSVWQAVLEVGGEVAQSETVGGGAMPNPVLHVLHLEIVAVDETCVRENSCEFAEVEGVEEACGGLDCLSAAVGEDGDVGVQNAGVEEAFFGE